MSPEIDHNNHFLPIFCHFCKGSSRYEYKCLWTIFETFKTSILGQLWWQSLAMKTSLLALIYLPSSERVVEYECFGWSASITCFRYSYISADALLFPLLSHRGDIFLDYFFEPGFIGDRWFILFMFCTSYSCMDDTIFNGDRTTGVSAVAFQSGKKVSAVTLAIGVGGSPIYHEYHRDYF